MAFIYSTPEQYDLINKGFMAYNIDAVYQSIGNILGTPIGTRIFLPRFGSAIEQLLFEPMNEITTILIYDEVIRAIQTWEPRVILDYGQSDVKVIYEEHKYEIRLVFQIRGLSGQRFEYIGTLQE